LITDGTKILSKFVENLLFLFIECFAHGLKEHALIIRPHMEEGVLPQLFQHGREFGICGILTRTQVL